MGNSSRTLRIYSCLDENISSDYITPEYWDSRNISEVYTAYSIGTAATFLLLMLIGIPANMIIILSIIYQRLYKETTHILLLNLAISDLLVCLLVMPLTVVAGFAGGYIFGDSDYIRCQVCKTGLIFTGLTVFSVNILGLISVDRFIFIKFPLRYKKLVTVRRVIVITILTWLLSIIEAILPLFGFGEMKYAYSMSSCYAYFHVRILNNAYAVLLVALALPPVLTIIITNVWIASIVRSQIKKIYTTRNNFDNKEELSTHNKNMMKQIEKKKNWKQLVLIRAFGGILISNIIVWIPLLIMTIVVLTVEKAKVPLGVYVISYILIVMHSVLHPLIEGCFIPEVKMTFKKVLGLWLYQKLRKRSQSKVADKDVEAGNAAGDVEKEEKDDVPTRGCCDVCSFAVLPHSDS